MIESSAGSRGVSGETKEKDEGEGEGLASVVANLGAGLPGRESWMTEWVGLSGRKS